MSFGKNLATVREKRNIDQKELGILANVSQPAISQFERNKANPSPETIGELAKALNVTCDCLIYGLDYKNE